MLILDMAGRFGDGCSQLFGNAIPCKIEGVWQTWSDTANESTSAAADRHDALHGIHWPRKAINGLFFWQDDHCALARRKDEERAERRIMTGERIEYARAQQHEKI